MSSWRIVVFIYRKAKNDVRTWNPWPSFWKQIVHSQIRLSHLSEANFIVSLEFCLVRIIWFVQVNFKSCLFALNFDSSNIDWQILAYNGYAVIFDLLFVRDKKPDSSFSISFEKIFQSTFQTSPAQSLCTLGLVRENLLKSSSDPIYWCCWSFKSILSLLSPFGLIIKD